MTDYRVTYKRSKPAGSIQFDPSQEFVDIIHIPKSTPEEATQYLQRNMPYLDVLRIERLAGESAARYGEARYGESHYYAPSIMASGASVQWPDKPGLSSNLSTIGVSISEFVSSYSGATAIVQMLHTIGVDKNILSPLQKNIEMMRAEAERLTNELSKALDKQNQERLQQLATESEENRERQTLASDVVGELVSCNLLSKKKLSFEFFNCSPDIVNALHTPCRDEGDFRIKIGALANIFEIDLKPFKVRVKHVQAEWKLIKLFEVWASESSLEYDSKMLQVWKTIVDLRNATFPYHATDTRIVDLMRFFGQSFPPDYTKLWKSILKSLLVSITQFRDLLGQIAMQAP